MIHYAIIPVYESEEAAPIYEEVAYKGYELLACKTEWGYIVERIYSTNPVDFINPEITPGAVLENSFINKKIQ
ncbi:MAG: YlzJ-like family protein [Cellulosilyticaceae bacterium]